MHDESSVVSSFALLSLLSKLSPSCCDSGLVAAARIPAGLGGTITAETETGIEIGFGLPTEGVAELAAPVEADTTAANNDADDDEDEAASCE